MTGHNNNIKSKKKAKTNHIQPRCMFHALHGDDGSSHVIMIINPDRLLLYKYRVSCMFALDHWTTCESCMQLRRMYWYSLFGGAARLNVFHWLENISIFLNYLMTHLLQKHSFFYHNCLRTSARGPEHEGRI